MKEIEINNIIEELQNIAKAHEEGGKSLSNQNMYMDASYKLGTANGIYKAIFLIQKSAINKSPNT